MNKVIFNYYEADIKKSIPLGSVDLCYLLNAIKNPKKDIEHIFLQIRDAEEKKDLKSKQELKSKLYSFTPCVIVKGSRRYLNIVSFTSLLVLDFDHLATEYAIRFKKALFDKYPFIIAAWLSASQHGVRALVKIPICESVEEFKARFAAIENDLSDYNGFDTAPKNCILPMFISYDKDLLHRNDATTYTKKFFQIVRPPVVQYIITEKASIVEKIIYNKIQTITDSGHIILRATAYLLGGYVGANYIEYNTALNAIYNMIDAHFYLRQKSAVYKKTAKTMIDKGILVPTYLTA
ncbi:MAG: hypothetical protein H0X46_02175 [Bacteroidetes bacterium]|nr:hypothetical protein [Bacteroidota bacterium]